MKIKAKREIASGPDVESLNQRQNNDRGKFGLLVCSNVEDEDLPFAECVKKTA
jgi:hypothetical protein